MRIKDSLHYLRKMQFSDSALLDTMCTSLLSLLPVFFIGVQYGAEDLGNFSAILIFSSLIYLVAYNFVIVPVTSNNWGDEPKILVAKVLITASVAISVVSLFLIIIDHLFFQYLLFYQGPGFAFIVATNVFHIFRRSTLHYHLLQLPTLFPLLLVVVLVVFCTFIGFSLPSFLYGISVILIIPIFLWFLWGSDRQHLFDWSLLFRLFRFSRWMGVGIWFQWLSGNVIQVFVLEQLGPEGLGKLRLVLSSFGFLSIYFQYYDIRIPRYYDRSTSPLGVLKKYLTINAIVTTWALIIFCIPVYVGYCYAVGVSPDLQSMGVYAAYQFLVYLSVVFRAVLRLNNDLKFASIGYCCMVLTLFGLYSCSAPTYTLFDASMMYFWSMLIMSLITFLGIRQVEKHSR